MPRDVSDRFKFWGPDDDIVLDFAPMLSGKPPLMFSRSLPEAGWRPFNSTLRSLRDVRSIREDEVDLVLSTPVSLETKKERMKTLFRKAAGTSLLIDGVLEEDTESPSKTPTKPTGTEKPSK